MKKRRVGGKSSAQPLLGAGGYVKAVRIITRKQAENNYMAGGLSYTHVHIRIARPRTS